MLMSLVIVFWFDFECVEAKHRYFDAQRLFKQDNSRLNRHSLLECKRFYKQVIRKKKYSFQLKKLDSIERLKHCKPKEFWNYFEPLNDKNANQISLDDVYAYFSNLENDIFQNTNAESETCVIPMILIVLMLIMMFMIWTRV